MDENAGEGEPTYPFPDCERRFNAQALVKHKKNCKKFQTKRKAFNMLKHRMEGE